MAETLKATWQNHVTCSEYAFTVFKDGGELFTITVDGSATSQEFFAADYPAAVYAAHAVPINGPIPCEISVANDDGEGA